MAATLKILLVDDEPLERQALRFILSRERPHYQVAAEAGNGLEAVELADALKPDVVFLDIKMPGMDGLAAGRKIRALLPESRLVFVSAYGEFDYAREAVSLGASKYLLKPVDGEEMIKLLDELAADILAARRRRQETARLKEALEEMKPLIRLGFIMDLLNGNITANEAESRALFLGITSLPRLAILVDIDNFADLARDGAEIERQLLKQRVKESIEKEAAVWPGSLVAPVSGDEFAVLLPLDRLTGEGDVRREAVALGEAICRRVRRETGATVTVGIGRPVADITELARSYAEAAAAAEYRLLYGGDQVIHADDVAARSRARRFLPDRAEQELAQAIRMGDGELVQRLAGGILMELTIKEESPSLIKMKILELVALATNAALEAGADAEIVSNLTLAASGEFLHLDNLADVRRRILERLVDLVNQVASSRERRNTVLIERACRFIEANFHRDLTLEEVAQQVYLSPCYFSRLFKQVKGQNFIDYLTRVRLGAAKELLLNTELPVAAIAERVGYHDARYFGQVFKKQEGYTPGVFRKIGGAKNAGSVD
ncbi:response regulator [Neomoorella humiferrea]|uniref:response regulator n=1 Tax=Neomoorella humiferrea TaxID=676965 RepID=UPI003D911CB0